VTMLPAGAAFDRYSIPERPFGGSCISLGNFLKEKGGYSLEKDSPRVPTLVCSPREAREKSDRRKRKPRRGGFWGWGEEKGIFLSQGGVDSLLKPKGSETMA